MKLITSAIFLCVLLCISCNNNDTNADNQVSTTQTNNTQTINYYVTSIFPHDTNSFTEGLLVHENKLYESTGFTDAFPQTRSLFGEVDLKTGTINIKAELDKSKYFGEGITFLMGKVYQLTYRTKIGFIYDATTFKKLGDFTFPGKEGWGMTTDSISLVMSDGTNMLYYLDPASFKTVKTLSVTDEIGPAINLNELEYIKGFIYANIFTTNTIIKIDPGTGKVLGKLDLSTLKQEQTIKSPGTQEMNGIAYNPATGKIYVTGKLWPNIYEIQFSD